MNDAPNRWKRFADWDERPLRLDKFAVEDWKNGFAAFSSPADPKPGVTIKGGRVVSLDGVAEHDFDMIDRFIASYHLDPEVAPEAMAMPSEDVARMLVDMHVPREKLTRLAHGMTPAKLADVVSRLNALEIAFAYSKMRARKTPGNQGHVTNAKDDPLQLAADAAIAVALGFDEVETTMRVARNAWSNAVACAIGAAVGRWGTLFQCSSEEAEELQIGMAGFTSYAETVSVYGTEKTFVDGDDTPWSKAFLAAAYASRGIKMRCTSGAGSELLMGFHESKSLLYLEARCLCLQRGMGVQGTQKGSDLICSGMGSILAYDNSFNPSLINGEELEDYLVLQRDFEADGGLTPISEGQSLDVRARGIAALSAVYEELGLATATDAMKASVLVASGSDETKSFNPRDVAMISEAIKARGITVIDVIKALAKRGFRAEAENLLNVVKLRISGDYLQTSAMVRDGKIVSAVNDPNTYAGPGSGYRLTDERRREIMGIRDVLDQKEVLRSEAQHQAQEARNIDYRELGEAAASSDAKDVVIGISPAFGLKLFQTTAGHKLSDVLSVMVEEIKRRSLKPRIVRFRHTADTSFLGLSAARLAGSGVGIGIQAKGTAVIHQKDRLPHHNLELFSNAPITRLEHYRGLGANAAAYALSEMPEPVVVPTRGEAMGSRYHARVAMIYAIETAMTSEGAAPIEVAVTFKGAAS